LGYLVAIPTPEITYPDLCPLCGKEPTNDYLASHHIEGKVFLFQASEYKTHRWTMPVCSRCKKRLWTLNMGILGGLTIHLAGWVLLFYTVASPAKSLDLLTGILLLVGAAVIAAFYIWREWYRRAAGVRHIDSQGVLFFARDASYAALLAAANSATPQRTWRKW